MHLVLETLQSDPPYLLENRTPHALQYRQVGAVYCLLRRCKAGCVHLLLEGDSMGECPPDVFSGQRPVS